MIEVVARPLAGSPGDYLDLIKYRTIPAHLFTTAAAMFLAAGGTPPAILLLVTLLGEGLAIASANTLNCLLDRDIDSRMSRTLDRPLPAGRIGPRAALIAAAFSGAAGLTILGVSVRPAVAVLALVGLLYYVLVYTFWLKRRTSWGPVACSPIGAVPPLIGWVAVTGAISPATFVLPAIVAAWSLPHFWSLAQFRRNEYGGAGLRIPAPRQARIAIAAGSSLLVAASLIPAPAADLGPVYLGTASLLGAGLLHLNVHLFGRRTMRAARRIYVYSIVYLAVLFGSMMLDRIVRI